MQDNKRLELIRFGRTAELLLDNFGSYIELSKDKKLRELKQAHKMGKTDAVTLASLLAAYCALDDLASDLSRDVKKANSQSKETYVGPAPDSSA